MYLRHSLKIWKEKTGKKYNDKLTNSLNTTEDFNIPKISTNELDEINMTIEDLNL